MNNRNKNITTVCTNLLGKLVATTSLTSLNYDFNLRLPPVAHMV